MSQTLPPDDDDLSDLDADLVEAVQAREARIQHAKLVKDFKTASRGAAIALQHELEFFTWRTISATALFHKQTCAFCNTEHKFFMGWMSEQTHIHTAARRLVKGKPLETLHERVEVHDYGTVCACAFCIAAQLKEPYDVQRPDSTIPAPTPVPEQARSGPDVPREEEDLGPQPDVGVGVPAG